MKDVSKSFIRGEQSGAFMAKRERRQHTFVHLFSIRDSSITDHSHLLICAVIFTHLSLIQMNKLSVGIREEGFLMLRRGK